MKTLMSGSGVIASLASVMMLGIAVLSGGCGGGETESIKLENYEYDYIAEELPGAPGGGDTVAARWRCQGSGLLPLKIGGHDIKALRDTLESIARVEIDGGESKPKLPEGYSDKLVAAGDKSDAPSIVINKLAVALMTQNVMVWRNYHYAYADGAAHGNYLTTYINYSLKDGEIITYSLLFNKGTESALLTMIRDILAGRDDLIVELAEVEIPENFHITADGVTFVYPLYAVAPYSSGEIEVPIDSFSLSEILTDYAKHTLFDM